MRERRLEETEEYEKTRRREHVLSVVSWLSSAETDQEDFLHEMADKRQPEICEWILSDDGISAWLSQGAERSTVWLKAKLGAGKSFLSSMVVDSLMACKDYTTLYYFCSRLPTVASPGTDSTVILRTLAVQLVQQNLDVASLIHEAYVEKASFRSTLAIKRLLMDVRGDVKPIRIVLDGIDEFEPPVQKDVIRTLLDIQRGTSEHCKILISSRDEPTLRLSMSEKWNLNLQGRTTGPLTQYIRNKIAELQHASPFLDHATLDRAEERLLAKADGMFLWVHLIVEHLKMQPSLQSFIEALEELPQGLDEAYGLILKRFGQSQKRSKVLPILFWLCAALRPLTTYEIADGVVLSQSQALDQRNRIQDVQTHVVDLCKPLVEETRGGVLQLVHSSAKEYLLHEFSGRFINHCEANLHIALACVRTLDCAIRLVPRYSGIWTEHDQEVYVLDGSLGLHNYAHAFWLSHIQTYLEAVHSRSERDERLMSELQNLSRVYKHLPTLDDHSDRSLDHSGGIAILSDLESCYILCTRWLKFKRALEETMPDLKTIQDQQDWKNSNDETFLSLIETRFGEITEKLLAMDRNTTPSHINRLALQAFQKKYGWNCRHLNCAQSFPLEEVRNIHEVAHVPTFPCDQCDFSGRGFRSRKDLERHTRRYHSSTEDQEIPGSLNDPEGPSDSMQVGAERRQQHLATRYNCWNEQGRAALKKGFRKILQRLETQDTARQSLNGSQGTRMRLHDRATDNPTERARTLARGLAKIRFKIEAEDAYNSLSEFQQDLEKIPGLWSHGHAGNQLKAIRPEDFEPTLAGTLNTSALNARLLSLALTSQPSSEDRARQNTSKLLEPLSERYGLYWSSSDTTELQKLVGQHGRNFKEIAQRLNTKTPDEIQARFQHLVQQGDQDLAELADKVELEHQRREQSKKDILRPNGPLLTGGQTDMMGWSLSPGQHQPDGHIPPPAMTLPLSSLPAAPALTTAFLSSDAEIQTPKESSPSLVVKVASQPPVRTQGSNTSRKGRFGICSLCKPEKQFRDEYTWKKHFSRVHEKERRVWICSDASVDGKFLSGCKCCDEGKSYESQALAAAHLKEKHFHNPSASTHKRWLRYKVEPNPRFRFPGSASKPSNRKKATKQSAEANARAGEPGIPALNFKSPVPTSMPNGSNGTPLLPGCAELIATLQSHDTEMANGSESLGENKELAQKGTLLPNISFGISSLGSRPHPTGRYLQPHERNKALVRPDQIPQLPYLPQFQREACKDQVEELHFVLSNTSEYTEKYQTSLASLERLSQVLLHRLQEWRREQSFIASLPALFNFDQGAGRSRTHQMTPSRVLEGGD